MDKSKFTSILLSRVPDRQVVILGLPFSRKGLIKAAVSGGTVFLAGALAALDDEAALAALGYSVEPELDDMDVHTDFAEYSEDPAPPVSKKKRQVAKIKSI